MKTSFLLIDDDKVINYVNKIVLSQCGFTNNPEIFTDARMALDYLNNHHSSYDKFIILLDINMPEMDGWEFLDIVSQADYKDKLVVFMLTSSMAKEDVQKSKTYDMVHDFISKPMTEERCMRLKNHPATPH